MKFIKSFAAFFLFALSLRAGTLPPVIYVMDFDASQAKVSLGQDAPVTQAFTEIAAMTLSNDLVKRLSGIAPARRITQRADAKAPGWLITGSFQSLARADNIAVTGLYKMEATAVLSDLSDPGAPLATFPSSSSTYQGNESNEQADGGPGVAPEIPKAKPRSEGDQLAAGIARDSERAAQRIVAQLKKWMSGT